MAFYTAFLRASHSPSAAMLMGLRRLQETEPERFRRGDVLHTGQKMVAFSAGLQNLSPAMWRRKWPDDDPPPVHDRRQPLASE